MSNKHNGENSSQTLLSPSEQLLLFKSIMESSTEYSIIALDLKGKIVAWNAGAAHMYGYNNTEIIGKNVNIIYHPDDIKFGKIQTVFDTLLQKGTWSGVLRRITKKGNQFNAFVTVTLRKDANNQVIGYTIISRDLTELENVLDILNKLKASEALLKIRNIELARKTHELQNTDRLKSEFLANVSHELRTPLNAIIGFTELIYDGTIDSHSPKYTEFLGDIIASGKHLLALINELLDLAKIEAGKFEFFPTKIDFVKFVKEIKDDFISLIAKKNIRFEINIDPIFGDIIIDADRLRQVINNYISNAIKFTPAGGQVTLHIYRVNKKDFRIEVQDTGIGIRHEDLNKLFVKFIQLNAASHKTYQGTGLGLALVKHIVEAQGGQVGVESIVGKGSTFYAILPCFPYHRTVIKNKMDISELSSNVEKDSKILVIEHESIERQIMLNTLMDAGYTVMATESISAALKYNNEYQFDVIILDLFLPHMGHWQILRNLRSSKATQAVSPLVISAAFEQPLRGNIHGFLIKPVEKDVLLAELNKIGIDPHSNKSILIIDADPEILSRTQQMLTDIGFRVICRDNKVNSLLALEQESPDVVILDPYIPDIDAYEFLLYYHQTERGSYTPIIIWTQKKLSDEERLRLKVSVQRVILKGNEMNLPLPEGLD